MEIIADSHMAVRVAQLGCLLAKPRPGLTLCGFPGDPCFRKPIRVYSSIDSWFAASKQVDLGINTLFLNHTESICNIMQSKVNFDKAAALDD